VAKGSKLARKVKKAQVLLAADSGGSDEEIARLVVVGTSTVYRVKRRFVEEGVAAALTDRPRPGAERKLSGKEEALLMATACSKPPPGRCRWTLELLAGELVRLTEHQSVSAETVRRRLHEKDIKPWQKKMWCVPAIDGEYVARMEDVLDLFTETPDPSFPVICFDESPTQLIEKRLPIPARAGTRERYDYEYRRNGTANLFVFLDAHRPWRHVKVTDQRTALDFAECMRDLVDVHYPNTHRIRVVLDNLSTHARGNLYEAFSGGRGSPHPQPARIPLHAQARQLAQHGGDRDRRATHHVPRPPHRRPAYPRARSGHLGPAAQCQQGRVRWLFDVDQARRKLARAYPKPARLDLKSAA
jgi:transposase